jgi:putative SOS response-associated peptidase YedK
MCGRFSLTSSEEQIAAILPELIFDFEVQPRYNIAPTQDIPAVLNTNATHVQLVHWGLVPHWAKDRAIGSRMINARAESLAEKNSFRRPLRKQRCIVLADGFYEWQTVPGQKQRQPMYIRLHGGRPFAFAGLWDAWRSPEGEALVSATLITTPPNTLIAPIHDRMPAILPQEHFAAWLSPEEREPEDVLPLLAPFPATAMEAYAVSTRVNRPGIDDRGCISPSTERGLFD